MGLFSCSLRSATSFFSLTSSVNLNKSFPLLSLSWAKQHDFLHVVWPTLQSSWTGISGLCLLTHPKWEKRMVLHLWPSFVFPQFDLPSWWYDREQFLQTESFICFIILSISECLQAIGSWPLFQGDDVFFFMLHPLFRTEWQNNRCHSCVYWEKPRKRE